MKTKMLKYTIKDFRREFTDDATCLEWLKNRRYPNGIFCKNCDKVTKHHRVKSRPSYECDWCGNHVHPMAGTMFHKSPTPLTIWFYAIYLMAQTRGGISAKQIQRETGVTYKTAWRMFKQIRKRLDENGDPFSGNVEADESYFGGKHRGTRGRGSENKTPVFGMVERKGRVKAIAVPNVKSKTVLPIVKQQVQKGATIHTDEYPIYNGLAQMGYAHKKVLHSQNIYVMGDVHTNTIDGFWSLVKRGINGTYHHVSPKYLQQYLNEYAFRYNHRNDEQPMFQSFLHRAGSRLDE